MSATTLAADALLVLGVLAELVCVAGLLWMRDVFDRLHFAAASTTVGPLLVAVAVVLTGMSSVPALVQSVAALALLMLLSPLLTHATARALHRRRVASASGAEDT